MLIKSSTELVRQQNSALVLTALRRHGPLAHTELSDHTGLVVRDDIGDHRRSRAGADHRKDRAAGGLGRGRPRVAVCASGATAAI